MQRLGYGPDNPLAVKVAARNIPLYRDPAVMLIDQLKEISIAGELDIVETSNWNPKVTRRDYMVRLENTGSAVVDDPVSNYTRVMLANPTATLPDIAIAGSRICSIDIRARPTRKGVESRSGISIGHCRRRERGRSFFIRGARPAGSPR